MCWWETPFTKIRRGIASLSTYSTFWYGDQVTATPPRKSGSARSRESWCTARSTQAARAAADSHRRGVPAAAGKTATRTAYQPHDGTCSQLSTAKAAIPQQAPAMSSVYASRGGKRRNSLAVSCETRAKTATTSRKQVANITAFGAPERVGLAVK